MALVEMLIFILNKYGKTYNFWLELFDKSILVTP